MVSGVLVTSRHFRPSEWARMQEVGYAGGGEDEGLWGSMGGGGVSDEEEGGGRPSPPRQTPPQAATQPPPQPPQNKRSKERFAFESGSESDDAAIPTWLKAQTPRPHPHRMAYEGRRRPQTQPGPQDRHPPPPRCPRPTAPRLGVQRPRRRTTVPTIRSPGRSPTSPTPPG